MRRSPDGSIQELVPAALQRPHPCSRVWRRSLYRRRRHSFFNFADGRLYRLDRGDREPRPITPEVELRYADAVMDKTRNRLLCVREDHTNEGQEATNTIVALDANKDPTGGTVLIEGCNFYSSPRLSPDGAQLAWLSWNHPNMPWDGCELWVADFDAGRLARRTALVAGGADEVDLPARVVARRRAALRLRPHGWWNLYRWHDGEAGRAASPMEAEFGAPQWVVRHVDLRLRVGGRHRLHLHRARRMEQLAVARHARRRACATLETPFTDVRHVARHRARLARSWSPARPPTRLRSCAIDLDSGAVEIAAASQRRCRSTRATSRSPSRSSSRPRAA